MPDPVAVDKSGMETKWCNGCQSDLNLNLFKKRIRNGKPLYRHQCRECENEYARNRRKTNPEDMTKIRKKHYANHKDYYRDHRFRRLAKSIGVDFYALRDYRLTHSGQCDICGSRCITGNSLALDHDHKTGNVRGLLCQKCNLGLGKFNDDSDLLQKALKYLGKNPVLLAQVAMVPNSI